MNFPGPRPRTERSIFVSDDSTNSASTASQAYSDATSRIREIFGRFRFPGFDLDAYIQARQADIDAISKATSVAFSGAETITQKQAELLKSTLEEINSAVKARTAGAGETPADVIAHEGDIIRSTLSRTLEGMKEMAEAAQKSQTEIYEIALDRARSNAEQLRTLFKPSDRSAN
jgi:phasin family protein